ncbi:DUF3019 domain-containing protein [Pseudoalteromonas sp. MMG013]|uniref:DUF3019 domain-containing protein n=1 Tax=unclassified Pseudoalteromonas TaxID=194690 RepID=UPI001B372BD2|nr:MULTISPECIES: DUF3019 domain-containing protein [unclassified Pseudoalteromonas]MBQ4851875.1 DUF3019 domain-containing protein [Pseudoalteromonas sp. MMG012]MBQ4860397.1 DUF3019 domain-containing protein [Pseudoalteromonas sp. MMG013]
MHSSSACLFSLSLFLSFQGVTQSEFVNQVPFDIKPVTCIVHQLGEPCQMTISLQWQNPQVIDACLYQEANKLRCWKKQSAVQEKLKITLAQSMNFSLFDLHGRLLATQTVNVHATVSKRYRRKLKTDWSFF